MKYFINYLKGLATIFYFSLPVLFYVGAVVGFTFTCRTIGATSFYWLAYSLFCLGIAIVLTYTIGFKHFLVVLATPKKKEDAATKSDKKF